ncbi:hypothetical protein BH23CHL9_BH23CHL9_15580 [soil metagenome]
MPLRSGQNGDMQRSSTIVIGLIVVVVAVVIGFLVFSQPTTAPPLPSPEASESAAASASAALSLAADLLERRWTILYVGTDLNAAREEDGDAPNADSLLVVSASADQSELTLISLPRDTVDVPLEDGGTYDKKINALYQEQGIDALVGAMSALYDVPIDGYVVLDMDDFTRLVDAVGTIEVNPEAPLTDPIVDLDLEPGPQEIDGFTANGYVRTRVDQDYGRMGRQQEVLVALVAKLVDPETDVDLDALLDGLDSLETDLPLDELGTLMELARRTGAADVRYVLIEPPLITFEGDRNDGRGYILEADVPAIQAEVQELIGE